MTRFQFYFVFPALISAHLAVCAAAILFRPAAEIMCRPVFGSSILTAFFFAGRLRNIFMAFCIVAMFCSRIE